MAVNAPLSLKRLSQRGPTTGPRAACCPRNNFAQVLSITSSGNPFFLENAMILGRKYEFGRSISVEDLFFFFLENTLSLGQKQVFLAS